MVVSGSKNYHDKLLKVLKDVEADGTTPDQYYQSLNRAIEHWEEETIDDIRQYANETRAHVYRTIRSPSERIDENLRELEQLFLQARNDQDADDQQFFQWSKKLEQLRQMIQSQPERQLSTKDAPKDNVYQRKVRVPTSNRSSIKSIEPDEPWEEYPVDQEASEFVVGKYFRRFHLEDFGKDCFLVIGIVSGHVKHALMSYKNPTFYGWTKGDLVYLAGVPELRYRGYRTDHRAGTCLQLTLDCDQQRISLINENTRQESHLFIDLDRCPLPWTLCVYFHSLHD